MLNFQVFSTRIRDNKMLFYLEVTLLVNQKFEVTYLCNVRNNGIDQMIQSICPKKLVCCTPLTTGLPNCFLQILPVHQF